MQHIYDVAIIGGGPAGYTAALYASRAGLNTILMEKNFAGGQMALTGDIDNYPGFEKVKNASFALLYQSSFALRFLEPRIIASPKPPSMANHRTQHKNFLSDCPMPGRPNSGTSPSGI